MVPSASAVGKDGTEYEWSVTKGQMSPMKMIEVFVISSIDIGSKLIFCRYWYLLHTENSKFTAIGVTRVLFRAF